MKRMALKGLDIFVGTRPEAIKLAPLARELRARWKHQPDRRVRVISTDQHLDLVTPILSAFGVDIDVHLNVMTQRQTLSGLSALILKKLEDLYLDLKPGGILVQGDTTTAFIVALHAHYEKVPLFHVEAGLRTHERYSPFPEEMNRVLVARLAHLHFCPTEANRANLLREGIPEKDILLTGNTVVDAVRYLQSANLPPENDFSEGLDFDRPFLLVTCHRRENWGANLENICRALKALSSDHQILFSVHPNPVVRETVERMLAGTSVRLSPHIPYLDFFHLLRRAALVLTDSGGIQEEGCALGKRVLVLRDSTERPEGIDEGFLSLIGTSTENILAAVHAAAVEGFRAPIGKNPFGEGESSRLIAEALEARYF